MQLEKNILFITSNKKFFLMIKNFFPKQITFFFTYSIQELSEFYAKHSFSLLIFDYDNNIFKNNTILQYLNNKRNLNAIPFIFLISNSSKTEDILTVTTHNNMDFIVKSPNLDILKLKIDNFLKQEESLNDSNSTKIILDKIFDNSNDMFVLLDLQSQSISISKSLLSSLNIKNDINHYDQFIEIIHPADRVLVKHNLNIEKLSLSNFKLRFRLKAKYGYVSVTFSGEVIKNDDGNPACLIGIIIRTDINTNITSNVTVFDELTGLPTKQMFFYRFKLAMSQAKRTKSKIATLILDLDNFKRINDSLGHNVGDALLKLVAQRLKDSLRECDSVARIGGDEYAFLLSEIQKPQDAVFVVKKIFAELSKVFEVSKQEIYLSASIGISFYPDDGIDSDTLIKNATYAMSKAKNLGQNTYYMYKAEMNAKTFEILALENRLRKAIQQEELIVHYQPRIDIDNGDILGMEALVRWQHPDMGIISPAEFIPIAEETGLIVPIGEQVLYKACTQYQKWMEQGIKPFKMAVNLSAKQFRQINLAGIIQDIVAQTKIDPHYLELEITESMAMKDVDLTVKILNTLIDIGIRIAIDDFGTGYSSLSYLRKYPIHILKIDQSFLREMVYDEGVVTIIKAILELAKGLNLDVVVEGVETIEQLEMLRTLGCFEMQGFLFSRPLSADDLTPILKVGKISITGVR